MINKKVVILGNINSPMGRPEPYSWFVLTFRQGLKLNGYELYEINYKTNTLSEIKQKLINIKPSICFTHLTFHNKINPIHDVLYMYSDVSKQINTKFVHYCGDARKVDRYMGDLNGSFHTAFVGTNDMLINCRKSWNIPVHYLAYSSLCYDKMSKPSNDLSFNDPVFTGSPTSHSDRYEFIKKLKKKIKIKIFQTQSSNDIRYRTPELSISSKCILGLCTGYDIDGYADVRWVQFGGTGAVLIMRKFKNFQNLIPDDLYYPIHSYNDDGVEQTLEYWNKIQKENTTKMRENIFNYIQQNHNCKIRLKYVLNKIERGY